MSESTHDTDNPVEIVVAFVEDDGFYPRADRENPSIAYWKAIAVMAQSLRSVGKQWPITVSTNRPPTDPELRRVLDGAGVTYRETEFSHQPPEGYFERFSGSLYFLDALADAVAASDPETIIAIVDPDCVWVRDPSPMVTAVTEDPEAILAYEVSYASLQECHGLTYQEMGDLFRSISDADIPEQPPYAGGEFLMGYRDQLAALLPHFDHIWQESLRRFDEGTLLRANTEEHILSYALGQLGWTAGTANEHMRRLWTFRPPHNNVRGDEDSLILWHSLTEKARGLPRLYDDFARGHPALSGEDPTAYRAHLARRLNVNPSPVRRAYHWARSHQHRLSRNPRRFPMPA